MIYAYHLEDWLTYVLSSVDAYIKVIHSDFTKQRGPQGHLIRIEDSLIKNRYNPKIKEFKMTISYSFL